MTEQIQSPRERARGIGGTVAEVMFNPKGLALLAGAATFLSITYGLGQMLPEWSTAVGYLQATQPDLTWLDASARLLLSSNPNVIAAERLALQVGGSSVMSLQTWAEINAMGLPMPIGVNPDDYVLSADLVNTYFRQHVIDGGPGVLEAVLAGMTLILANMIRREGKGPKSEYSPEFAQVQRRYDLNDLRIVERLESLLNVQKGIEIFKMKQTYFKTERCTEVINQLFKGNDGKQRKKALTSIGLGVDDEIQEGEFRLVTRAESPSIVLRVKRGDKNTFGKETYYADQGYPPLLDMALTLLTEHVDVTTVKTRTELKRNVLYIDPKTGKNGTTTAVLNYDRYYDSQGPEEGVLFKRIEIVVPALAGVKPENIFPEFFTPDILGPLEVSQYNDKQIGYIVARHETGSQLQS